MGTASTSDGQATDGKRTAESALHSAPAQRLSDRLKTGQATIGVIGLGYIGFPLAVEFAEQGFETRGIDLNSDRVDALNQGQSYIGDLDDGRIHKLTTTGRLYATSTFKDAEEVDVFFICVPTPVTDTKDPDTSHVEQATRSVADNLRSGQLIVLKSTTYPETTETVVCSILEAVAEERELTLGEDYFLAHSPERIDPGNKEYTTANTPIVVGGVSDACTRLATTALEQIVANVHPVSTPKVAEMEKLLENIFRSVNIALVNELAQLCDRMGDLSMWEVIEAAATKPFGFMPFYPGPGLGGHCIPVDPHYLSWLARRYDFETSFITLSARVNEEMPFYVVDSVIETIARSPVELEEAEILILGVAFKRNVDDTRHSPAGRIIRLLWEKGIGDVRYHDPYVEEYTLTADADESQVEIPSVPLTPAVLKQHDTTVIVTDHDAFDPHQIAQNARRIVDTRNALKEVRSPELRSKIFLLGGRNSRFQ